MIDNSSGPRDRSIPRGRLSRFGHFGQLAGGVAGGMVETLFVQRKISGTALLAARLKARVDVTGLAAAAIC